VSSFQREPESGRLRGEGGGPVSFPWAPAFAAETAGRDARPTGTGQSPEDRHSQAGAWERQGNPYRIGMSNNGTITPPL